MKELLDFLNTNAGTLNFLAIAVTACYVVLTYRLVKETKMLREAQTQPKLSIYIKQEKDCIHFFDLVIENIGASPAHNIKFNAKSLFKYTDDQLLSDLNLFKNGLSYLGPKQSIQFFLTNLLENFKEKLSNPLIVDATYSDAADVKYTDSFHIDFSWLDGLTYMGGPSTAKGFKGIEQNIKEVATELQKLRQKHG
jgi:hypothetical protein